MCGSIVQRIAPRTVKNSQNSGSAQTKTVARLQPSDPYPQASGRCKIDHQTHALIAGLAIATLLPTLVREHPLVAGKKHMLSNRILSSIHS